MNHVQTPIWRQVLTDSSHPLHRAAWDLFRPQMRLDKVAPRLDAQKEEVIPFVRTVFRDRQLYEPGSLGGGEVPYHCIALMAHWQIETFIEDLIPALAYTHERFFEGLDFLFDRIIGTLSNDYGAAVIDPIFEALETEQIAPDLVSGILARSGQGDNRCYRLIQQLLDEAKNPDDIEMFAHELIICDRERGVAYVRSQQTRETDNDRRRALTRALQDV